MAEVVVTKTIKIPGVGQVLCVEVGPGNWCWSSDGFAWKWNERIEPPAFNFAMYVDGARYDYRMRTECIEHAVIYSIGFTYGYKNGEKHGEEAVRGVEKMVDEIKQEQEGERFRNG